MNKLVIANWGKAEQGKTTTIKEVFKLLSQKYPTHVNLILPEQQLLNRPNIDVKAIIKINGVRVGIESQGDPQSRMSQSMDDFVAQHCEIIVAACRTKGDTYNKINNDLHQLGYDIIWAPNDKYSDSTNLSVISELNNRYATRIIQLIEDRIAGII